MSQNGRPEARVEWNRVGCPAFLLYELMNVAIVPMYDQRVQSGASVSANYILPILFGALLASCGFGPERWEPHVLNVGYIKNGQARQFDLGKTGPTLVIDAGEHLEFLYFTLQLFPTKRSRSGATMTRVKDVPPVPESALRLLVRVSATIRKWQASGPCYDKRDQILTEWVPARAEKWELRPPKTVWIIKENWDEIRIDVHLRSFDGQRGPEVEGEYTINSIVLRPTGTGARLRRNVDHNIFMRILESFREEQFCSE